MLGGSAYSLKGSSNHRWRWRAWLLVLLAASLLSSFHLDRSLAAPAPDIAPGCINLVEGGNFDSISASWLIQPSPRPPMYTNEATLNGSPMSLRLGNGLELPNVESISEVQHVPIQFPANATRIILRFRYSPRYDAAPGNDLQQVDLYRDTNQLALSILNVQENDANWKLVERDLTAYRGQLISLRFRVRNDGLSGRTWMYIDNVEIEYCALTPIPSPTPTTTATPTGTLLPPGTPTWPPTLPPYPTATFPHGTPTTLPPGPTLPPPPAGCHNIILNGSFETYGDWYIGEDPVPPRYVSEQWHSGGRSMLLGYPPGGYNFTTYSSIRQLVTLPYNITGAQLRWWELTYTQEPASPSAGPHEDRQEVILLAPDLSVIAVLARTRSNTGAWQQRALDLMPYRGRSFYVYFNVFNNENGARTWMYLDDVELYCCAPPAPLTTPTFPAVPTFAPTPIPSTTPIPPTETPVPPTPMALVEPPIAAVQPTATEAGVLVVVATATSEPPATATPVISLRFPTVSVDIGAQPAAAPTLWTRLGTIAVLLGILVIIGFLVVAIIRTLRTNP